MALMAGVKRCVVIARMTAGQFEAAGFWLEVNRFGLCSSADPKHAPKIRLIPIINGDGVMSSSRTTELSMTPRDIVIIAGVDDDSVSRERKFKAK